jgi:hypothetical protein
MALFVFLLGLILTIGGCGGLLASIDLLPTEIGLLYAGCGVMAVCSGFIVISLGVLARRLDALGASWRVDEPGLQPAYAEAQPGYAQDAAAESVGGDEPHDLRESADPSHAERSQAYGENAEDDEPVNENRTGHIPTLQEFEDAILHPEEPPTLVGRYSAGGANYMIFSDGTIEAETEEGQFRFASMGDFKAYIAGQRS